MRSKAHAQLLCTFSSTPAPAPIGFARQWQLSTRSESSWASPSLGSHDRPRVYGRHVPPTQTRSITQKPAEKEEPPSRSYDTPHSELNHDVSREEKIQYDNTIARHSKEQQIRTPWHRADSEKAPVARLRQASAMTKGKILTTPTRLFKLVLPLTTRDHNDDRKSVEPLALLVHPSQPLSYLERLIQSELPLLTKDGVQKIPDVNFRAEDAMRDDGTAAEKDLSEQEAEEEREEDAEKGRSADGANAKGLHEVEGKEEHVSHTRSADSAEAKKLDEVEGEEDASHTHLRSKQDPDAARELRGGPGEGGVETYSGVSEQIDDAPANFVRWSKSTEIGDFIRDASRGNEFAVEIEGAPSEIRVGVPSFGDRTYYLRLRLRKKAKEIANMADVKKECDMAAHNYSQNIAKAGFGGMCAWGGVVAWLTFETDLGWDVMEPVTYLVGLVGLLGGYAWFLANNREASYRAAMNLTVSRRQQRLYDAKGFDLNKYNALVEAGNALRKEIMAIASEYDVEWDEKRDAQDERVVQALKEHRDKKGKGRRKDDDDDDDD